MIRLAVPDIQESDIARVVEVLRSGNLVQAGEVAGFEQALAEFTGIEHGAAVSSGTAALHLALLAIHIHPGDAVIVPAFTFPATANVVEAVGAEVVLCDVDPRTYVMTPEALSACIQRPGKGNIKAVIVVHEFGYPARMAEICALARRNNLRVIEDAACALGTTSDGTHVGAFGDLGCFSFHPRKAVTTGEGGLVVSRDRALIEAVKELRNHGMHMTGSTRDFVVAGLNYRMTEFQAALGAGQLVRFPQRIRDRRKLADCYRELLHDDTRVTLPASDSGHTWQTFMVMLGPGQDRDKVITVLAEKGVQANLGAQAINCLSYYRRRYGWGPDSCPVAARLYNHGLALPLHGRMIEADVREVVAAVSAAVAS
jgi:dTDP-4-amino-4,6-dideoxygalactose transaminase